MALSGRATERWGGGLTALLGGVITIVGTVPFVLIGGETSFVLLSAAMIFRGFGIGMSMMPSMTAAFAVLRPDQVNHATPQLNVVQRVGGSIGTAILSVALAEQAADAGPGATPAALADAFGSTYVIVLIVTLVGAAADAAADDRRAARPRRPPPPTRSARGENRVRSRVARMTDAAQAAADREAEREQLADELRRAFGDLMRADTRTAQPRPGRGAARSPTRRCARCCSSTAARRRPRGSSRRRPT